MGQKTSRFLGMLNGNGRGISISRVVLIFILGMATTYFASVRSLEMRVVKLEERTAETNRVVADVKESVDGLSQKIEDFFVPEWKTQRQNPSPRASGIVSIVTQQTGGLSHETSNN